MLDSNLIRIYERSFRENSDLPALTDYISKQTLTYHELAEQIARLHILFETCGIRQGDRIALIGRNTPAWVVNYIAVITYGAVIVPILQDFAPDDVNHILRHSGSRLLFLSDAFRSKISPEQDPDLEAMFSLDGKGCIYRRDSSDPEELNRSIREAFAQRYPNGAGPEDISYPDIPNGNMCLLNYTSGTTGFSKGVMLSVNNLTAQVEMLLPHKRHLRGSTVLAFLPLAHAYGCAVDMICSLAAGSHIFLLSRIPSPRILTEALQAVKPRYICSVPLPLEKVVRTQITPQLESGWKRVAVMVPGIRQIVFSRIRTRMVNMFGGGFLEFIIGGAPLNKDIERFLHRIGFPIVVGYGMTECGPMISYLGYREGYARGSAGRVAEPYTQVRIQSEDPRRIPGEILVKGENVMMGYYRNPDLTAEVIDSDGWLHTGDIGTLDSRHNIFIKGRCKTMLLGSNGQNIYPEEIEAKINNIPYVTENLVVDRQGHLVVLIVPDRDAMARDGVSENDWRESLGEHIAHTNRQLHSYEQISGFEIQDKEFEKTPKKSIKRFMYS